MTQGSVFTGASTAAYGVDAGCSPTVTRAGDGATLTASAGCAPQLDRACVRADGVLRRPQVVVNSGTRGVSDPPLERRSPSPLRPGGSLTPRVHTHLRPHTLARRVDARSARRSAWQLGVTPRLSLGRDRDVDLSLELAMAVIKPRTRGRQFVRHRTRLEHDTNETLYAYAEFIGESTEYVLNQLIDSVLAKDRDYIAWRATHPDSCTRRAGRIRSGRRGVPAAGAVAGPTAGGSKQADAGE